MEKHVERSTPGTYRIFPIAIKTIVRRILGVPSYRRVEDRIRELCQRLIESNNDTDEFRSLSAELQAALSEHVGQMRNRLKNYLWRERGGQRVANHHA